MRETGIVVVGGGLAGSLAAAMLARDGFDVVLVDPHAVYPPDLRAEKLDLEQVAILRRTGLADRILPAATFDGGIWVARFGRVVEKRRGGAQYGILYDTLVNTARSAIPPSAAFIVGKVTAIATSDSRQRVTLSTGEEISARLVIVANGLNVGLRHSLGMVQEHVSKCHSVTLAFDLKPVGRSKFEFPSLTYYPERAADRAAYLTLFPIGSMMRANYMVYRDMDDPWLREMRQSPETTMAAIMPRLGRLTGRAEVVGPMKIRPADLYVTRGHLQPGIVLVGDAFGPSCPAAGTGTGKVFTDVERLCNVHVPKWMASDGMGVEKIAAFYADPVKVASDRHSFNKAFKLRSISTGEDLSSQASRWIRFLGRLAIGTYREAIARLAPRAPARESAPVEGSSSI
jgi:2-polyprenyl-6-methoxyphenol hydroxylase-like FAD-dependent oxidoreductase